MNELALFAGAGGGILGGHLLGWRTVCAVEWEPYPASVLCARQNDGLLPPFPIWDDVQTFDGRPWRGIVDVISGGFPCQDISAAGKGAGINGERSGMWGQMARIIHEVRPKFVFVENSPMLTSRGLGRVLGDLASMGFNARWGVLGAGDIGAPHQRDRIWIVGKKLAYSNSITSKIRGNDFANEKISGKRNNDIRASRSDDWGKFNAQKNEQMAHTSLPGFETRNQQASRPQQPILEKQSWRSGDELRANYGWPVEPNVGRVVNGMASRVDRLKAIGNGQVSRVAATAWNILSED
jgi:DNA (cytosine-5)-methyltransferase 1